MSLPELTSEDRKLYVYWMNWIKRAIKSQPREAWNNAILRVKGEANPGRTGGRSDLDGVPYINHFRLHKVSQMSFLDQNSASFRVIPTDAFMTDEITLKRTECDAAFLSYLWREQKCQVVESKKLNSVCDKNIGFAAVLWDKKKMLPTLEYKPAEEVLLDPDAMGNFENMQAVGYYKTISWEKFLSDYPDLNKDVKELIKSHSGYSVTEDELKEIRVEEDKEVFRVVKLYYIYARNDAAVRDFSEDSDAPKDPDEEALDDLAFKTPRRYLIFAEGYEKALLDEHGWPFELDHDEFLISILTFNTVSESMYGSTDYSHMERMEWFCDGLMKDIEAMGTRAGNRKYGGRDSMDITDQKVRDFIESPQDSYLPNMIDEEGNLKLQEMAMGTIDPLIIEVYKLAHEMVKISSGASELLENDAAEFKDVTALAVRVWDSIRHQRVNRRLGGPRGFEASIAEDAVKLLEAAHQLVPRLSVVSIQVPREQFDEDAVDIIETGEMIDVQKSLPWLEAQQEIKKGGRLLKLGVDAIVGPELAQYWQTTDEVPIEVFRLTTKVSIISGSTRSVTKDQKAATLKQLFNEVLYPAIYQPMMLMEKAVACAERIGKMADIENMEDLLPTKSEILQFQQMQARLAAQEAAQVPGEAGGQPLNAGVTSEQVL